MKANRENRADNMRAKAERLNLEAIKASEQASKMASVIPFGQPILVDHYSAKSDRNYRAKIQGKYQKAHDLATKSDYYADRARAAENNHSIYADDDDPVAALDAKIATLEKERVALKAVPHKDYQLTNLSANIRRLKQRRESLSALKAMPRKEYAEGAVNIIEDPDLARIQLIFDGKPIDLVRDALKRWGFKWAPSQGAWQRNLNEAGRYAVKCVLKEIAEFN